MAVVNNVNRKELDRIRKEKSQKFKEQLKKFKKNPSDNFGNEQELKDNVLELYKNMSPTEKAMFDKELEHKKIRDNYALYLKYVYPPSYVLVVQSRAVKSADMISALTELEERKKRMKGGRERGRGRGKEKDRKEI